MSLSSDGYSEAVVNEIRGAVGDAIAQLPETFRLVYVLSEEQGMSYKEIADILGCPVGTVSSRKVEAVKKLRKLLRPLRDELLDKSTQLSNPGFGKIDGEVNK